MIQLKLKAKEQEIKHQYFEISGKSVDFCFVEIETSGNLSSDYASIV